MVDTKIKPEAIGISFVSVIHLQYHNHNHPYSLLITMKFLALSLAALVSSTAAFAPSFISRGSSMQTNSALDMARKPFISGNWKLNPQTKDEAIKLAMDIAASITPDSPHAEVALFVPYVFIEAAMDAAGDKLTVGAEVSVYSFIIPCHVCDVCVCVCASESFRTGIDIIESRMNVPRLVARYSWNPLSAHTPNHLILSHHPGCLPRD